MHRLSFPLNIKITADRRLMDSLHSYRRANRPEVIRRYITVAQISLGNKDVDSIIDLCPYVPTTKAEPMEFRCFNGLPDEDPLKSVYSTAKSLSFRLRELYLRAMVLHGHGILTGEVSTSIGELSFTNRPIEMVTRVAESKAEDDAANLNDVIPKVDAAPKMSAKAAFGNLMGKKNVS